MCCVKAQTPPPGFRSARRSSWESCQAGGRRPNRVARPVKAPMLVAAAGEGARRSRGRGRRIFAIYGERGTNHGNDVNQGRCPCKGIDCAAPSGITEQPRASAGPPPVQIGTGIIHRLPYLRALCNSGRTAPVCLLKLQAAKKIRWDAKNSRLFQGRSGRVPVTVAGLGREQSTQQPRGGVADRGLFVVGFRRSADGCGRLRERSRVGLACRTGRRPAGNPGDWRLPPTELRKGELYGSGNRPILPRA